MRFLRQMLLLQKRLLKKPGFIVILVLIPILVISMTLVSNEKKGILTVALARYDSEDAFALSVCEDILSESSIISPVMCDSVDGAKELVKSGKADAAWLFYDDLEERIYNFSKKSVGNNSCVLVYEREDNILLKLSREVLQAELYSKCTYPMYIDFIHDEDILREMSEDELRNHFNSFETESELFETVEIGGEPSENDNSYLVMPLRGLMSLMIVLLGLAVSMYWNEDEKEQIFFRISGKNKPFFAFGYYMTALLDGAAVMIASMLASGINVPLSRELPAMILFLLSVCSFCMFLRMITVTEKVLGILIPIIIIAMMVLCPVFLTVGGENLYYVRMALPPTLYLNSVHNPEYLLYMAVYSGVMFALDLLICGIIKKRKHIRL